MFCPQCATANAGEVKFCRSCGTPLEAVALAISGKPGKRSKDKTEPPTPQDWMEKRIDGVSRVTRSTILLSLSLLLAIPLGLFLPMSGAAWIFIWFAFFGWMTMWGAIELANGISRVFESKSRLHLMSRSVTIQRLTDCDTTYCLVTNRNNQSKPPRPLKHLLPRVSLK